MGGCSAFNCSNSSSKGHQMFRFPTNPERRKKWAINCRRDNWIPGNYALLCSEHFEDSQYEPHREGKKKLRQDAIPTKFNVPNPPQLLTNKRVKRIGLPNSGTILDKLKHKKENVPSVEELLERIEVLEKRIDILEKENKTLKEETGEMKTKLSSFLSQEQIFALTNSFKQLNK